MVYKNLRSPCRETKLHQQAAATAAWKMMAMIEYRNINNYTTTQEANAHLENKTKN